MHQLFGLKGSRDALTWCLVLAVSIVIWLTTYIYLVIRYHYAHLSARSGLVPPTYPSLLPYLSVAIPLLWNPRSALSRFTTYNGKSSVAHLSVFPGISAFVFREPAVIRQIWRQSCLLDLRPTVVYFFTELCGMARQSALLYLEDDSGDQRKPLPGSSVPEELRIHRIIHQADRRALTGRALEATLQRYMDALAAKTSKLVPEDNGQWIGFPDFCSFTQDTVGAAEIEAIFGPNLIKMHPNFVRTFFEFDRFGPSFLKKMSFGRAERLRHTLLYQLRTWFRYARTHYTEESIYDDGDGDPFWGSAWTRSRDKDMRPLFDDDAMSSIDLGMVWGATSNTVPCAMMAVVHVMKDPLLVSRLRHDIQEIFGDGGSSMSTPFDVKRLSESPLLCSVYAETLRLHVAVSVPVVPMHGELTVGKWCIPKNTYGLIPSGVSHMDENEWNTKGGSHPLGSFWAERFIVDPSDPMSGPVPRSGTLPNKENKSVAGEENTQPYFSTDGLEGTFMPYGGGRHVCQGRFMAKSVIHFTLAMITINYDVEILIDGNDITMDKARFGTGTETPTCPIPFRIRRRQPGWSA